MMVASVGTWLVYRAVRGVPEERTDRGFRYGQIGSASLVSLAHGTNDAQKTMGVIFLALISYGAASKSDAMPPFWVILSCALAIALGTYLGGWRVIRTLGKGLVEIKSPQGMAAETSSAAIILLSSHFGFSLSTTHVATGSILGSGVGKPGAEVRWGVAGRMAAAWLITLPSAGIVGAITYFIVHLIGGYAGILVGFLMLVGVSAAIWLQSRKAPIDHTNVNAEWEGNLTAGTSEKAPAPEARDPRRRHLERPTTMSAWFNYTAVFQIIVAGLLVGAGLPALFSLAVRMNAEGSGSSPMKRVTGVAAQPAAVGAQLDDLRRWCCWR